METASHSSFIKSFMAVIAEGALIYELLKQSCAVRMFISQQQTFGFLKAAGSL